MSSTNSGNVTLFRATSLIGPSAALFLSGFSFCASFLAANAALPLPTAASMHVGSYLFQKGAFVAVPLAVVSALSTGTAAYLLPSTTSAGGKGGATLSEATAAVVRRKRAGLVLATLLVLGFPIWTNLVMMGTNNRMVEISNASAPYQAGVSAQEAEDLLKTWRWTNFVRSAMGAVAGVVGLISFAL